MRRLIFLFIFLLVLSIQEASAKPVLTFEGEVDLTTKQMDVFFQTPDQERSLRTTVHQKDAKQYQVLMDIQHLQTSLCDLSTQIVTDLEWVDDQVTRQSYIAGKIHTQYALVDYKPIEDFKGTFAVKDQTIYLQSFDSKQLKASGEIEMSAKPKVDMAFDLNNVNLNGFLNFWTRKKSFDSDGRVSGTIHATGYLKDLTLRGDLVARDGFIKTLEFEHIYVEMEGVYPYMQVSQAKVAKADGLNFSLTGPIDLSKRKSFKQQIKDMSIKPLVKGSEDQVEWTIRSSKESQGSAKYELKYSLRKDDFEKDHEDKAAGIIGIQRSMDF